MKSRTFVISDIHGCYDEFNSLLKVISYEPREDALILLGDYVDRGKESKKVIEQVSHLVRDYGVIALRGNHDQRFIDLINNEDTGIVSKFFEHGGEETFLSYKGNFSNENIEAFRERVKREYSHHLAFIEQLPFYHEDSHHIYVHAGLNPRYDNWKEQTNHDFMYIKEPFIKHPTVVDKIVVFGHTNVKDIHGKADIWFGGDKIGIDGGCAYGLQLNCLEIRNNSEYVAHSVKSQHVN